MLLSAGFSPISLPTLSPLNTCPLCLITYNVHQGSVLGSLMFILYTTPLSSLIKTSSADHHLYITCWHPIVHVFLSKQHLRLHRSLYPQLCGYPNLLLNDLTSPVPESPENWIHTYRPPRATRVQKISMTLSAAPISNFTLPTTILGLFIKYVTLEGGGGPRSVTVCDREEGG